MNSSRAGSSGMTREDPFRAIEGQAEAVSLLRRVAAGDRIAHAYAFIGPEGSGRKAAALAFARALVAPAGGPAAERVERGAHPTSRSCSPLPPRAIRRVRWR